MILIFYLLTTGYSFIIPRIHTTMYIKSHKYDALNENQEKYTSLLDDNNIKLVISVGSAGTGKTLFACQSGFNHLDNRNIEKILITRPTVTVNEDIGFLPGNLNKKMAPWMRPVMDILKDYKIPKHDIEISPLGFMRGRTFKNYFIIADEMQNSSPEQMIMLLTRMGENSKIVITGDLLQSDNDENGLKDLIDKINCYYSNEEEMNKDGIGIVYFNEDDIKRSKLVKTILFIYSNK